MKRVAFVPVRLNSQRVEGKNLRELGGRPLMTYLLETLTRVDNICDMLFNLIQSGSILNALDVLYCAEYLEDWRTSDRNHFAVKVADRLV